MTVWVVELGEDYEGSDIIAIFGYEPTDEEVFAALERPPYAAEGGWTENPRAFRGWRSGFYWLAVTAYEVRTGKRGAK